MANILTLFQKIKTGISIVDQVIEKLDISLKSVFSREILSGQLIGPISLDSGDNQVPHGLGRPINGYILTRVSDSTTLYDKESTNTLRSTYMTINSSTKCTAYFWVF